MEIIYATTNKEKKNQVQELLENAKQNIKILTLKDIGFSDEIEENGSTFEENSEIKAKAVKEYCIKNNINKIIVADDAGLMVDALGGKPGIYSARYAGDHAPQEITLKKLLKEMENIEEEKRGARFVCVLTAILENGEEIVARGETRGKIAKQMRNNGKTHIYASIHTRRN